MEREEKRTLWTSKFVYLLLATFGLFLGYQTLLIIVPLEIDNQGGSSTIMGFGTGIFVLAAVAGQLSSPRLLARYDIRLLLVVSVILLGMPSFFEPLTESNVVTIGANFVRGAGFGLGSVVAATAVSVLSPPAVRGKALGLFGLMTTSPSVVGPVSALVISRVASFDLVFIILASVTLVACLPTWSVGAIATPEGREDRARIFSVLGRPVVLLPFLTFIVTTAVYGSIVTFAPLYLSESQSSSPTVFIFLLGTTVAAFRFSGGVLVDRLDPSRVLLAGLVCSMSGVLLLGWRPFEHAWILAALLFGSAFGSVATSSHVRLVSRVSEEEYGAANTVFNVAFTGGIGFGSLLFGVVAQVADYSLTFIAAGLWVSLGVLAFAIDRVCVDTS